MRKFLNFNMKGIRNLLICVFLSGLIGWAAGFLRLPYIEKNFSFLLGFIAGSAFIFLILILILVSNQNISIRQFLTQKSENNSSIRKYNLVWTGIGILILAGSLICLIFFQKQNTFLKNELNNRNEKINQQSQLIETKTKFNFIGLWNDVLNKLDSDFENNTKRILSESTIVRLVELNHSLQPDKTFETDSLVNNNFSYERGRLLLNLAALNLDSSSFNQIKRRVSFQAADLKDSDLRNLDLSGIDLKQANLKGADLRNVNIKNANLSGAVLWGAKLRTADLSGSVLQKTNLKWSDANQADLRKSDLTGAILNDANFRNAKLNESTFEWTTSINTNFVGANFSDANLRGTDLASSNLTNTIFINANLNLANLSDAIINQTNLSNTDLTKITVGEEDWIEKLKEFNVIGAEHIDSTYKTIRDPRGRYGFLLFKK